jgi:hypothetical protein
VPIYRLTYNDERNTEIIEAERMTVQSAQGLLIFHHTVTVMGSPREIVIRRVPGATVDSVDEVDQP